MINTKTTEFGRFYQCVSCRVWYPLDPEHMGAMGDCAYCPDCAKELAYIEELIVSRLVLENKAIPDFETLDMIKNDVWINLGINNHLQLFSLR